MNIEIVTALIGAVAVISAACIPELFNRLKKTTKNLKETTNNLERAKEEIDTLNFLVSHMLTQPEKDHLRKLESAKWGGVFEADIRDNFFDAFREEIRHLYNMGFITYDRKNKPDLFDDPKDFGSPDDPKRPYIRRVDKYCKIENPGEKYLNLLKTTGNRSEA